jgi:hypothetical protein
MEHFAKLDDLSLVMSWLQHSIAWSDIQCGFATEEERQKIFDAFESSRLPQKLCEKFSENEEKSPTVDGVLDFVGFLAMESTLFNFFSRLLRVGFVDSLRDFLKTFSDDATQKSVEERIIYFLSMYDLNGGDLDALAEGTPEEWLVKLREFFFPIYQAESMSRYINRLCIEVVSRGLKKYTQDEELLDAMWVFCVRLFMKNPYADAILITETLIEPIISVYTSQGGKMSEDNHALFADFCHSAFMFHRKVSINPNTVKTVLQHVATRIDDHVYTSKVIRMCNYTWEGGLSSAWTQSGVLCKAVFQNLDKSEDYRLTSEFIRANLCFSSTSATLLRMRKSFF